MSRRINNIDAVALPVAGSRRGLNGNTALPFLLHEIHYGSALIDVAYFVRPAGVIQHTLGSCGFTCVNMSDNADIPYHSERKTLSRCAVTLSGLVS